MSNDKSHMVARLSMVEEEQPMMRGRRPWQLTRRTINPTITTVMVIRPIQNTDDLMVLKH